MTVRSCLLLLALWFVLAHPARATDTMLPAELDRLIRGAAVQTDPSALNGLVVGAIATRPDLAAAILARVAELAPDRAAGTREAVRLALGDTLPAMRDAADPVATRATRRPPEQPAESDWSGRIRLGGGADFGKTNRQTATLGVQLRNERDRWRHDLDLDVDFIRNDADTLQRDIATAAQSRYTLDGRWFAFGLLKYEDKRPSPFRFRTTEIAGLGYRLVKTADLTVDLQAGPGLRQTRLDEGDTVVNEVIAMIASEGMARLSDTARLTSKNELIVGSERTTLHSRTALAVSIIWSIDAELSVTIDHDTKLPGEDPNTEVKTAIALVYGF